MKFRTKLVLLFAAFFFLVVSGMGIYFYQYSTRQYLEEENNNLKLMAEQVREQFHSITEKMEYRMRYLLSDPAVLRSMIILGDPKGVRTEYVNDARDIIQNSLIIDSTMDNFYRVIYFNEYGEVVAMKSDKSGPINKGVELTSMPWLDKVEKMQGKTVLINTHKDAWGYKNEVEVFSMIKKVLGKNTGYIEIQFQTEKLKELLKTANPDGEIILLSNETELLYSSADKQLDIEEMYLDEYLYGRAGQKEYGIQVIVREDKRVVMKQSAYILKMCLLIMVMVYLLLLFFVVIISYFLTKPLKKLRKVMESTELENMEQAIKLEESDDEITALCGSYQDTMARLKKSMIQEKRMAVLQMEAQFDSLQAQVNPHFIYNVLNVISGKGIENGDESICVMCGKLAAMLRYSADTSHKYDTVDKEIEYLEQYLYLLKCRYDYKLNFEIHVDEKLMDQEIPKIVLQQIVENCMSHGFDNKTQNMVIQINGVQRGTKFRISVQDNGRGFTSESLQGLRDRFCKIRHQLLHSRETISLAIGGMGLVNAYARLLLFYGKELEFHLGNNSTGAIVWFQVPFKWEGEKNVPGIDFRR